jgi:nitrate/nitrite transport system substrate-binding protein
MDLEKTHLKLGFVPLCDAAPLLVARERGFFAEQGLDVALSREASWASIRDKVSVGVLDGAHMLAPMPLAATLGLGNIKEPMLTAMALSVGGNAITLSTTLAGRMAEADPAALAAHPTLARALKAVIAADQTAGRPPLTFAVVYPFSPHNYELRWWLAAAGIDPDRDVRLVVVPPSQMVANLSAGAIDGFCAGAPWNEMAAQLGLGRTLITSGELWGGRIEKVFAVRQDWAYRHPRTHKALLKALLQAAQWADAPENRGDVAAILAQPGHVNVPPAVAERTLADLGVFHRHAANFPWRSQALWTLVQMRRWSQWRGAEDPVQVAEQVFRADLYRLVALELGWPVPLADAKIEGIHPGPWELTDATAPIAMGADAFFDGGRFDPALAFVTPPSSRATRQFEESGQ